MVRRRKRRYPLDWDMIAAAAKDRADWKCEACGIDHIAKQRGAILTVHQLDDNTLNSANANLIALCQVCRLRAEKWSRAGESIDREECVVRLREIIRIERAQRSLW